jgi:molybdopterin synthase catalytic subunit
MAASEVRIQREDFDPAALQQELTAGDDGAGALVSFVGLVRAGNQGKEILRMELEHYPGMTERSIQSIIDQARERWDIRSVRVLHRIGELQVGEQIVYVGVSGTHRGSSFQACEFIMDYLKTRAPFWKKESTADGAHWVDAREADEDAARRWVTSPE